MQVGMMTQAELRGCSLTKLVYFKQHIRKKLLKNR